MSPLKHQNEKWMSIYEEQPERIAATAMFPYLMRWGYPEGGNPADGIIETSFIFSDMLQEVVVKKRPVDEVLTEYQKKFEELYSSYK
jgi:ABC-type glycerol-3-phosphate transport system substrate-binding protein